FVGRMENSSGHLRHPKPRQLLRCAPNTVSISQPCQMPARHALQLNSSNYRLDFGHPPVGPTTRVQPAKPRWMLLLIRRIPGFTMILIGPHALPQIAVIGGNHAPFTASGHDLILAERPSTNMPN